MNRLTNIRENHIDHLAIRQLIDYYNDIINNRNWEALPEIFSINSSWEALAPINLKFEGIEEIKSGLPKSVQRMKVLIQSSSGIIVEVKNSDEATARSLMTEFGRPVEDGEGFHAVGFYHDHVIKENGEWKFLSRRFELKYFDTLPVPGTISGYKY